AKGSSGSRRSALLREDQSLDGHLADPRPQPAARESTRALPASNRTRWHFKGLPLFRERWVTATVKDATRRAIAAGIEQVPSRQRRVGRRRVRAARELAGTCPRLWDRCLVPRSPGAGLRGEDAARRVGADPDPERVLRHQRGRRDPRDPGPLVRGVPPPAPLRLAP